MKQTILLLIVIFNLISCSSVDVKPMGEHKIKALPENAEVKVYSTKEPPFRYEKICKITLNEKATFGSVSATLSDYEDKVRTEARKCGAKYAVIKSSSSLKWSRGGGEGTIWAFGVKKISKNDTQTIETAKKVIQAVQLGNLKSLKKLLKKMPKKHIERGSLDQHVLSTALIASIDSRNSCSQQSFSYLVNNYDARLMPEIESRYGVKRHTDTEKLFHCLGLKETTLQPYANRIRLITSYNNFAMNNPRKKRNIKQSFNYFYSEVNKSCQKDEDSQVCMFKPRMNKIKKMIR